MGSFLFVVYFLKFSFMKKILSLLLLVIPCIVMSQNVGIGTATPNASAQLDIQSTSKGLLVPRMTDVQMKAIASPAKGLLVFNSTDSSFYMRRDSGWVNIKKQVLLKTHYYLTMAILR